MSYRIMVVDDDPNILGTLKDILVDAGYTVVTADSVQSAGACLAGTSFDLLIIDLNLPDGAGLDLAKKLRAHPPCPRMVMMTGQADSVLFVTEPISLVDAYLVKPIDVQELLQIIKGLLA